MAEPRVSSSVTSGDPVPLDATCTRCRREGVFCVGLYALTPDGPRQVGERVFCVCETRAAQQARGARKPLITNGDARRTGESCERCKRVTMFEVPFFAMTDEGVTPHSVRIICRDCDTRPKR